MNVEKLSLRLDAVANHIPNGARLADIGSDHAYLPCHVVKGGRVPFAIAGEVVEGPYQSAKKQVESEGLNKRISVRKGNGLEVVAIGEVDCITIAGMGGALIASILEEGVDKLEKVSRLVLQPNISAKSIRVWLLKNDWSLIAEEILEEDGKIYEVLVAERGNPYSSYNHEKLNQQLLLGPFLMEKKTQAFMKKWHGEINNWKNILEKMNLSKRTEEQTEKIKELTEKIAFVEEVLSV